MTTTLTPVYDAVTADLAKYVASKSDETPQHDYQPSLDNAVPCSSGAMIMAVAPSVDLNVIAQGLIAASTSKVIPSSPQMNSMNSSVSSHFSAEVGIVHMCDVCYTCFKSVSNLYDHKVACHNANSRYTCSLCKAPFQSVTLLKAHEQMHDGVKKQICFICGKAYAHNKNLKHHLIRVHAVGSTTANKKCKMCDTYIDPSNMSRHIKTHSQKNSPFSCPDCGKSFLLKKQLTRHMHVHNSKFICQICGKTFAENFNLTRHMKTHVSDN